jgi:hypothetical protein
MDFTAAEMYQTLVQKLLQSFDMKVYTTNKLLR